MPMSLHARITRRAISPRFAIKIFFKHGGFGVAGRGAPRRNQAGRDTEERLSELNRLAALHENFGNRA